MTVLDDANVEEPSTYWREVAQEELETRLGNAVVGFLGLLAFLVFQAIAFNLKDAGAPQLAVEAFAIFALMSLGIAIIFLGGAAIATVKETV